MHATVQVCCYLQSTPVTVNDALMDTSLGMLSMHAALQVRRLMHSNQSQSKNSQKWPVENAQPDA